MKLLRQIAIQFGVTFVALALLFTLGAPMLQRFSEHPVVQKAIYTLGFAGEAYAITPDYEVDGNADDVQVQAALDALPSTGGKLILYAGTWDFNATVSRAINNVTIEGDGKGTYLANNAATALFSAGAQTGWVFKDFRTDAGYLTVSSALDTIVSNVYNNTTLIGKTVRDAKYVIASVNATATEKAQADWVCDGTADDVQIQAAADAIVAAGQGGTISLTGGDFRLATQVDIEGHMIIRGQGIYSTTLILGTNTMNGLAVATDDAVVIEDLRVSGGAAPSAGAGIVIDGSATANSYSRISNVALNACYNGIDVQASSGLIVEKSVINSSVNYGIKFQNTYNDDMGDAYIRDNSIASSGVAAIEYESGGGLKITDNKLIGGQYGLHMNWGANLASSILLVAGNSIENQTESHIYIATGANTTFTAIAITGNQMAGLTNGTNYGIHISSTVAGAPGAGSITGNIMGDSGSAGTNVAIFFTNTPADWAISGNVIYSWHHGIEGAAVARVEAVGNEFNDISTYFSGAGITHFHNLNAGD